MLHFSARLTHQNRLTELLLSSVFINLLSLALPFTMLQIYDRILPNQGYGTASVLVIAVMIAIFLELILRYARSWLLAASSANYELQTTNQAVNALMKADYSSLANLGTGKIASAMASITKARDLYSGQAAVAMMDFPFVIIFLGLLTYIGGPLVFIPLIIWAIVGVFVYFIGQKLTQATNELALTEVEYSRMLLKVLSGFTTAKALALEVHLSDSHSQLNYRRLEQHKDVDWLSAKLQEIIQGASQATTLLIVIIGCFEVLKGNLTTGGLAACSILAGRAIAPLSAIISLRSRLKSLKTAQADVRAITNMPCEKFTSQHCYKTKLPCGPIKFEKVCAHASGSKLEDLSFSIPSGQLITVSSQPLSLASHVLQLVGAFSEATSGKITLAGIEQSAHCPNEYRQSIAYVPAWPTLFSGTIVENLTLFCPQYEITAMKLAEELGLSQLIAQLPSGYQTKIAGNESQMLNKGAIKLIAIIRALVHRPSILLLDEPMISLDIDSQTRLLKQLKTLQAHTSVIAATHFEVMQQQSDQHIDIVSANEVSISYQNKELNV